MRFADEGRQEKNNDKPAYICASPPTAKKKVRTPCVPLFFVLVRIWAFLGKGS
jgi:hypothetical protein